MNERYSGYRLEVVTSIQRVVTLCFLVQKHQSVNIAIAKYQKIVRTITGLLRIKVTPVILWLEAASGDR